MRVVRGPRKAVPVALLLCVLAHPAAAAMGSSNPQILYTPQQQMGYGGYSVPCRIGNWAEDEYLGVVRAVARPARRAPRAARAHAAGPLAR